MKYVCAVCGDFAPVPESDEYIDSGRTWLHLECGGETIVDLFRATERARLYAAAKAGR